MGDAAVDWSLYLVTDPEQGGGPEAVPGIVRAAVLGGVSVVQVRDKHCEDIVFARRAAAIAQAARQAGDEVGRAVPVFVNDRLGVAADLGLHLHVGQGDTPLAQARAALPAELMVGLSVSEARHLDVLAADALPDVIGLSPIWATATKQDTDTPLGPEGAQRLAAQAHAMGIAAVGIGGIGPATLGALRGRGLDGICVVSAIMAAADPRAAAAALRRAWLSGADAAS